ncbi:hypothetical protein AAG570_013563 [Ranatra chinensis]|uniref:Uncharacterized protein n=1 Tax=Ranatra chinensis TaxID=642074 RepID=A0ABD0YCJ5_9HEMI
MNPGLGLSNSTPTVDLSMVGNLVGATKMYLRNVSFEIDPGKPHVEFTADGVLKAAELKIMNLRPGMSKQLVWEEEILANKIAYSKDNAPRVDGRLRFPAWF